MYNMQNIRRAIQLLRCSGTTITTVNILRVLTGCYKIIHGISPSLSPNAKFGKYIRKNSHWLGVRFSHEEAITISGSPTTTAVWL